MRIGKVSAVLLVLIFSATSAMAAGFRLPEAGAKAMGMGFAFTAQADDPSAIYFNPAGLVQLEGNNVMVGATYIRENGGEFTGTTPLSSGATISETQKDLNFIVPNAYFTRKASPNLAYGVGIFSPFGLGQEYKDRNTSFFRNQVTKIDLQTIVVNPTIAYKVNEVLSVGAGIDFLWGRAKLAKTPVNFAIGDNSASPPTNNLYILDLEADGSTWGYNFGALLQLSKNAKIGFSHRSPFHLKLKDGDVDLANISTASRAGLGFASVSTAFFGGATVFHTKGSTTIELPATTALGLAYTIDRLTVEADMDITWWSSYNHLLIEIKDQKSPVLVTTDTPKNWRDVVALRIGAQYKVTDPVAVRLGYAYDPSPVPADTMDPSLPDADRQNFMVGGGYKYGAWTFDLSYFYVLKKDRTVNNQTATSPTGTAGTGFNGTWKGDAHLVAFDIGYRF
ncbi:MAG: outer membrane protein transport protein [Deltaproteobacteria bacterium]|nr:outer membrane protein transport protein [Deltaproteobacteria bacterium]